MEKLLPLGSVVKLKKGSSIIMIAGYYAYDNEGGDVKEYVGINFPLGFSKKVQYLIFDGKAVENVIHYGYMDEEVMEYNNKLTNFMKEQKLI